jgi:L-phenylalanine/L-methionine N-acetyltransferase
MKFQIRKIRESDISGYLAALNEVIAERRYLLTLDTLSLEHTTEFVETAISNNYALYVAVEGDKIVGWADIIPKQKGSARHAGELGIGIIAAYRGLGIGKRLLEDVIRHSWGTGLKRLELEVFASNLIAISLYERYGFKHEGTKKNARFVDGEYEDVFIMAQCRI